MIFYLMRHGETDWNALGRIQGQTDTALNSTGISQIRKVAEKIPELEITEIFSSDLKRAKKSAEIIASVIDVPIHYTKRLRELNFGKAEGFTKTSLGSAFPYIYQAFNDKENPDRLNVCYPQGETFGEAQQRFIKFLNKLMERKCGNILIVTHGMLIRIFAETVLKKNIRLDNGQILKLVFDEKAKKFKSIKILF